MTGLVNLRRTWRRVRAQLHHFGSAEEKERLELHRTIRDGSWNSACLGATPLPSTTPGRSLYDEGKAALIYDRETEAMVRRFVATYPTETPAPPAEPDWLIAARREISLRDLELKASHTTVRGAARPDAAFTIAIPFFRHLDFFATCLASLPAAIQGADCEVIVVNDDPSIPDAALLRRAPAAVKSRLQIINPGRNIGITHALNAAIRAAHHEWVVFLDCDDALEPGALATLRGAIAAHPQVRYISSCMIDIDEDDLVLRYRRRCAAATCLATSGMLAGHLKAVRTDAFAELGALEPAFNGCQDYEFALRLSLHEPILHLPDYLYRYRWHDKTQSVSSAQRQQVTTSRILDFIRAVEWAKRQKVPAVWFAHLLEWFQLRELTVQSLSKH